MEAASCEGLVTECEVRNVLKQVGLKSPGLDSLLYKVYLRKLHMFGAFPRLRSNPKAEGCCWPREEAPFVCECCRAIQNLPRSSDLSWFIKG